MPFGLIPVLLATLVVLGIALTSSKQAPRREGGRARRSLPLPSWIGWILVGYVALTVVAFSPGVKGQLPESLPEAMVMGIFSIVVTGVVAQGLAEVLPFTWRLFRQWRRPANPWREKRRLRREKKELRQRRALERRRGRD